MSMEKTYEMLWDCRYCGVKKNLGKTHRFCPNCGGPQSTEARYFPPDSERVAVEDHEFVGADVICPACKHPNSKASNNCSECGGPLDKGAEVKLRHDKVVDEGQSFVGESVQDARQDFSADAPPIVPVAPPEKKGVPRLLIAILVASVVSFLALIVLIFVWTRQVKLTVAGHSWMREIAIETYGPTSGSDWCDHLPAGARETGRHKQQRGSESVADGENCVMRKVDNGDGTFKEKRECTPKTAQKPVMADRCDYTITTWSTARTVKASGANVNDTLTWPTVDLRRPGSCEGCEREGPRTATYTVRFSEVGSKDEKRCDVEEPRWRSFKVGSTWTGKERNVTGGLACDTLSPGKLASVLRPYRGRPPIRSQAEGMTSVMLRSSM